MQSARVGHAPEVIRSLEALLALWEELRAAPGPYLFTMRGGSMWPAVPDGSILAVRPCPSHELAPGCMVTFRRAGTIVTHRVVEVNADGGVLAWGDSVLAPDAPIGRDDVLGEAVLVRRGPLRFPSQVRVAVRRVGAAVARAKARFYLGPTKYL
jgi:signal peptidase